MHFDLPRLGSGTRVGPLMILSIGRVSLVDLATPALGVLLRLGARHPRSTAVLGSGVLGLDALVGHDHYDTCCLQMS